MKLGKTFWGDNADANHILFLRNRKYKNRELIGGLKNRFLIDCQKAKAGSELTLLFLFISFGNHRLSDHLPIADLWVEASTL